jgi:hypothetical protein
MQRVIYFALPVHTGINHCRLSRHGVLYQPFFKVPPNTDEIQSSIASSLLHLVKTIEHGSDIKSKLENDRCKSDLTIAQL